MNEIIESVKGFLQTGYNRYILIGVIAVLVIAIILIVASAKKKAVERKVAKEEEEAMLNGETYAAASILDVELSPIDEETIMHDNSAVVVKKGVAQSEQTVIMTPVREKKRPIRKSKLAKEHVPQEKKSSFGEPNPSANDGKLPGTIAIYRDNGGKFRFRVRSSNGCTVGHSQGYTAKATCKSGIKAVENAAQIATVVDTTVNPGYVRAIGKAVFEIYRDNEDKFRFRLVAANASNVLASQGYTAKANCLKGVESIKRIAEYHETVDETK
ncbi:MAG: YegP family protein [Clostridia bacterium]|nr:YegP family protein [Clostridia bacterium]